MIRYVDVLIRRESGRMVCCRHQAERQARSLEVKVTFSDKNPTRSNTVLPMA